MQLALPVWFSEDQSFDTYKSSDEDICTAFLKKFILADSELTSSSTVPFCVLHSLSSAGKSHLLYASCQFASDNNASHAYFDMQTIHTFPVSIIQGAENKDLICIDNIQVIKDDLNWQIAIFDLLNKVIEQNQTQSSHQVQTRVILTATHAPSSIGLSLPDLVSRLNWGTVFKLEELSDEKLKMVIRQKVSEKGLEASDEVLNFIVTRLSRSLPELLETIKLLDLKSLESKRKLTIPFIKEVLKI